eukprot:c23763_g1_i1 orf=335-697(+)
MEYMNTPEDVLKCEPIQIYVPTDLVCRYLSSLQWIYMQLVEVQIFEHPLHSLTRDLCSMQDIPGSNLLEKVSPQRHSRETSPREEISLRFTHSIRELPTQPRTSHAHSERQRQVHPLLCK